MPYLHSKIIYTEHMVSWSDSRAYHYAGRLKNLSPIELVTKNRDLWRDMWNFGMIGKGKNFDSLGRIGKYSVNNLFHIKNKISKYIHKYIKKKISLFCFNKFFIRKNRTLDSSSALVPAYSSGLFGNRFIKSFFTIPEIL